MWGASCLFLALCLSLASIQSQTASTPAASKSAPAPAANSTTPAAAPAQKAPSKTYSSTASDSDIAAAKSQGKVWVNLDSKVYHKRGRWYGKTKSGKFMTKNEAKAAGYKASRAN